MAIFPKIQSPCPYKDRLASVMQGDVCRMCKRQVVDLTAMTDQERVAFMHGCAEEVCVSYRLPVRAAVAAMAVASAGAPLAAAAQTAPTTAVEAPMMEIIVGGIRNLDKVEYIHDSIAERLPDLPVVYERPATSHAGATVTGTAAPTAAVQGAGAALTSARESQRSKPAS